MFKTNYIIQVFQVDNTIQSINKFISIIFTSKFLSKNQKNVQMLTVHKCFYATPEGIVKSNTNSEYKIHIHKCYILDREHSSKRNSYLLLSYCTYFLSHKSDLTMIPLQILDTYNFLD